MTFYHACKHIDNYSTSHESAGSNNRRNHYPENHIEVDNRLSWFTGRLQKKYGDEATYVHLLRDKDETADSFVNRYHQGIIRAYREQIHRNNLSSPKKLSLHYCDTVNSNIQMFLRDKTKTIEFRLERAKEDFKDFWNLIDAEGDLEASLDEWDNVYNPSPTKKSGSSEVKESYLTWVFRKLKRIWLKLPEFLKEA